MHAIPSYDKDIIGKCLGLLLHYSFKCSMPNWEITNEKIQPNPTNIESVFITMHPFFVLPMAGKIYRIIPTSHRRFIPIIPSFT